MDKTIHKVRRVYIYSLLLCFLLFVSCSPSRFVKPLEKGQKAIEANLGGELIHFSGLVIPIPFTSVTGGYGIKKGLTGYASLHLTSLMYQNIHTEFGIVKELYSNEDSTVGVSVTPQINFVQTLANGGGAKLWPQLDANAYWNYKKGNDNFAYVGMSNWFELAGTKAHGEKQTVHWIPNIHVGHQFVGSKIDYFFEWKYIAPLSSNEKLTIDYWKPLGIKKGAIGVYLGLRKKF